MAREKCCCTSPFAALSYKEQQDRWMEWRSQQLDYRSAAISAPPPQPQPCMSSSVPPTPPPIRLPMMQQTMAQNQRRELDQVLARHKQALKQAGAFHPTSAKGL